MNIIMTAPALPDRSDPMVGNLAVRQSGREGESFNTYLRDSQQAANRRREGLLGVNGGNRAAARQEPEPPLDEAVDTGELVTVAGLLEQIMALLGTQAEKVQGSPGEWMVATPDAGLLRELALAAGMNAEEVAGFLGNFGKEGQEISLAQLLENLAAHFARLDDDKSITLPDTDFPMFEALLAKAGVSVESLESISGQVITGDDRLDLEGLLAALQELPTGDGNTFTMDQWDLEQLRAALQRAGLSEQQAKQLFPVDGDSRSADLGRLRDWLQQALGAIEEAKPQPAALEFLGRLEEMFNQAGFRDKGVGWSPVVQNSIETIYRKLVEVVDVSAIKAELVADGGEDAADGGFLDLVLGTAKDGLTPRLVIATRPAENGGLEFQLTRDPELLGIKNGEHAGNPAGTAAQVFADIPETGEVTRPPHLGPMMEQQTINQLSQAVMRGARNNEHHLVLRLYPEDLGEVKVNLHIKNDQVAVSFTMENSRVKEILEGNMQQFRDNLEQHGLNLGQCFASVDQQGQADDDRWRQFRFGLDARAGNGEIGPAEAADDLPYRRPAGGYHNGDLDLFI